MPIKAAIPDKRHAWNRSRPTEICEMRNENSGLSLNHGLSNVHDGSVAAADIQWNRLMKSRRIKCLSHSATCEQIFPKLPEERQKGAYVNSYVPVPLCTGNCQNRLQKLLHCIISQSPLLNVCSRLWQLNPDTVGSVIGTWAALSYVMIDQLR